MGGEEKLKKTTGYNLEELYNMRSPERVKVAWDLKRIRKINREQFNWLLGLKRPKEQMQLGQRARNVLEIFGGEVVQ